MTDTDILQEKIEKSGLKLSYIAKEMGISRTSLYKKIRNQTPFDQYEIDDLCNVLGITLTEKELIFFGNDVNKKITSIKPNKMLG